MEVAGAGATGGFAGLSRQLSSPEETRRASFCRAVSLRSERKIRREFFAWFAADELFEDRHVSPFGFGRRIAARVTFARQPRRPFLRDFLRRDRVKDPVACFAGAQRTAYILRGLLLAHRLQNRGFDLICFFRKLQMPQHHCRGQNCAERIGLVLACDRWGRSVDRLKH